MDLHRFAVILSEILFAYNNRLRILNDRKVHVNFSCLKTKHCPVKTCLHRPKKMNSYPIFSLETLYDSRVYFILAIYSGTVQTARMHMLVYDIVLSQATK